MTVGTDKTNTLRVRKMGVRDIVPTRDLFYRSIDDDFSYFPLDYRDRLRREHDLARLSKAYLSPRASFILLTNKADRIGYCFLRFIHSRAYLFWMYVDKEYRGIGGGARLLSSALDEVARHNATKIELVTHDKESFYSKYGFSTRCHVPGLVGGVDMTIMEYQV